MILNKKSLSSDLAFIEKKVREGNWFSVTGAIDAVTNTIEYVPASGKTAHLFEAKIQITGHSASPSLGSIGYYATTDNRITAALKIDTVTKDTTALGYHIAGAVTSSTNVGGGVGGFGTQGDGHFNCLGLSLEGNGSKKITIENIADSGSAIATMSGWLSDT